MSTTFNPNNGNFGDGVCTSTTSAGVNNTNNNNNNNRQHTSTLGGRSQKSKKSFSAGAENSRVLFLLYLIHRTWNIMVETVDSKTRR